MKNFGQNAIKKPRSTRIRNESGFISRFGASESLVYIIYHMKFVKIIRLLYLKCNSVFSPGRCSVPSRAQVLFAYQRLSLYDYSLKGLFDRLYYCNGHAVVFRMIIVRAIRTAPTGAGVRRIPGGSSSPEEGSSEGLSKNAGLVFLFLYLYLLMNNFNDLNRFQYFQ